MERVIVYGKFIMKFKCLYAKNKIKFKKFKICFFNFK